MTNEAHPGLKYLDPLPSRRSSWNGWFIDKRSLVYEPEDYDITITELTTPAKVLDWIMQIANKDWGGGKEKNDQCVVGLVRAINDILRPQGTLCSWGESRTLSVADIERRLAAAAA